MRRFFALAVIAASTLVCARGAQAGSSLPSTVPGMTIGNAHVVLNGAGHVLRGSAPTGKVAELTRHGITNVIVFKNQTGHEVDAEIAELRAAGYRAAQITSIPFKWKDLPSFRVACGQIVDALAVLDSAYRTRGAAAFFHCTVGEDRTGLLAGLFRLLEKGGDAKRIFASELCKRGYEKGNPNKPAMVVNAIRAGLTPLYLKMSRLILGGRIKAGALSKAACARDPGLGDLNPAAFVCGSR